MALRPSSLRTTLVVTLTGIMVAGVVLISFAVLRVTARMMLEEKRRTANALLDAALAQLSWEYDHSRSPTNPANQRRLGRLAETLSGLPDVVEVHVVGPSLQALASSDPGQLGRRLADPLLGVALSGGEPGRRMDRLDEEEQVLRVYAPLRAGTATVGAIRLGVALGTLGGLLKRAQTLILIYTVVDVLLLLLVAFYLLDRWLVRPVREMTLATERLASGGPTAFVDVRRDDELGRLAQAFNRLVERLARSRAEVERRIAELEEVNAELWAARDTVIRTEKLASVGTLAAGVAHEVGNPLSAILGYVNLLQAGSGPDREMLDRVEQQVLRIHEIIRELLAYARPEADAEPMGDVRSALETTKALLAPQPRFRGIEVRAEVADGLPLVAISEGRLQQVLVNLAFNASDAMDGTGTLRIDAFAVGGRVRIIIEDEGHGIPTPDLGRVFDPFYTTKEPGEGTGLGLAIVESLVRDHGGSVDLRSAVGEGTVFTVELPVYEGGGPAKPR